MFIPMDHPEHGRMEVVSNPIRLSKTPLASPQASAVLGQHTDAVLQAHGYTPDEIAALRNDGIIR
jgi:crotonobetainyl-CoA:carnitine CoA-transferase CaiB-like acyl-CoA transferase